MRRADDYERVSLEEFARRTRNAPFMTVDTEFVRERTYWAVWCLVQVAAHDEEGNLLACVADLLDERTDKTTDKETDKMLVRSVLYEGDALRVFHAGKQDWEILWRHFGSLPRHVFDTQVAAALLGYGGQCGYERLVRLCLSVELDKTGQYADWQKRPLSDKQIRYALGDVVYLARLYPLLRKRLEERGRLAWLEEIQAGSLDIEGYEQSGEESFLRLSTKMRGQEARKVLRRLCLWREGYAKRRDRPRQWICSDATIVALAKLRPACIDDVRNCRALGGWGKNQRMVEEVLEQVRASGNDDDVVLEELPAAREEERSLLSVLRALQRSCGEGEDVAIELLGAQSELVSFVRSGKAVFAEGWRYEVFGRRAEALLGGKLGLYAEDGKIRMVERQKTGGEGAEVIKAEVIKSH